MRKICVSTEHSALKNFYDHFINFQNFLKKISHGKFSFPCYLDFFFQIIVSISEIFSVPFQKFEKNAVMWNVSLHLSLEKFERCKETDSRLF